MNILEKTEIICTNDDGGRMFRIPQASRWCSHWTLLMLFLFSSQSHTRCSAQPDSLPDLVASMAFSATQVHLGSCMDDAANATVVAALTQAYTNGAANILQHCRANSLCSISQTNVRIQLDAIAMTPLIIQTADAFNAMQSAATVTIIPTPPYTTPNEIIFNRPTLPVDGRWSDFAGTAIGDLNTYLSPTNSRLQHLMFYRRDVLPTRAAVPQTWEQLLDTARKLNGTDFDGDGIPDYALCFNAQQHCHTFFMVLRILTPMLLYAKGAAQQVLFWADDMEPIVLNDAMRTTLSIFARLMPFNDPQSSGACQSTDGQFAAGKCAITFNANQYAQSVDPASATIRGRIGTAHSPGSPIVLDRATSTLLPCTPTRCPYAIRSTTNPSLLINFSPVDSPLLSTYTPSPYATIDTSSALATFASFMRSFLSSYTTAISEAISSTNSSSSSSSSSNSTSGTPTTTKSSPATVQGNSANTTSSSPASPFLNSTSSQSPHTAAAATVFNVTTEIAAAMSTISDPYPLPGCGNLSFDPRPLLTLGYDLNDTLHFLHIEAQVQRFPNNFHGLPLPGAAYYRSCLGEAALAAAQPGANLTHVLQVLDSKYRMVVEAFNDTPRYQQLYWMGIGYSPDTSRASHSSAPRTSSSNSVWTAKHTAGVAGAAAGLIVVVLLAWLIIHQRAAGRTLLGQVAAPGAGRCTTLLITDIQDSTQSWECLPTELMEAAIALHHATLRSLLEAHNGYESATEGDSFILAFHHPSEALAYAAEAQKALLLADWPLELLEDSPLAACRSTSPQPNHPDACLSHIIRTLQSSSTQNQGPLTRLATTIMDTPTSATSNAGWLPSWLLFCWPHPRAGSVPNNSTFSRQLHAMDDVSIHNVAARGGSSSSRAAAEEASRTMHSCLLGQALAQAWTYQDCDVETNSPLASSLFSRASSSPFSPSPTPPNTWGGLRVRMGIHSGLTDPTLASTNSSTRRTQYSGAFAAVAKSVCDAGHGGQILLSHSAFTLLDPKVVSVRCLLEMGEHVLDVSQPQVTLYLAVIPGLEARLHSFWPIRSHHVVAPGVLSAPVGTVTVVFMNASGVQTLLEWNAEVARAALAVYHEAVRESVGECGGYVAELVDGLALVVFARAEGAVAWALGVQRALVEGDWPEELLEHELCEPVMTTVAVQGEGGMVAEGQRMSVRGLRLKVGIATGEATDYINTTTARIMYRGRVMNWAARISKLATSGQVLCSEQTWSLASASGVVKLEGISAVHTGIHALKGINVPVHLYSCTYTFAARGSTLNGSSRSSLHLDLPEEAVAAPAAGSAAAAARQGESTPMDASSTLAQGIQLASSLPPSPRRCMALPTMLEVDG